MARSSDLASMSVEALLKMRDDIGHILSSKVETLQTQLAALGDGGWVARSTKSLSHRRGSALKGKKVAPKYRNPNNRSETWAGRGAMPRWMAAQIKAGKNREDFAISRSSASMKHVPVKRTRKKRKK
jgi:DNA-binding protein H-NS